MARLLLFVMNTNATRLTLLADCLVFPVILACSSSSSSSSSSASSPDAAASSSKIVTAFNANAYELAEGLVLKDGKAYVGLAPLGAIVEIAPDGSKKPYASVTPGGTAGYTLGLTFDDAGDLFVAETKNDPDASAQLPGIYKIPKGTPATTVIAVPFATDPAMTFPNGIVVGPNGNFLVTDSAAGRIFQVTKGGVVSVWNADPKLVGSTKCNVPLPFPIGANGIVYTAAEVFVTNTSTGSLFGIAVNADGTSGALRVITDDCTNAGFDGLARNYSDASSGSSFIVAQNGAPGRVVRVTEAGVVTTIPTTGLDGPASVALGNWNGASSMLVTSSAFFSVGIDGGEPPHPSLTEIGEITQ